MIAPISIFTPSLRSKGLPKCLPFVRHCLDGAPSMFSFTEDARKDVKISNNVARLGLHYSESQILQKYIEFLSTNRSSVILFIDHDIIVDFGGRSADFIGEEILLTKGITAYPVLRGDAYDLDHDGTGVLPVDVSFLRNGDTVAGFCRSLFAMSRFEAERSIVFDLEECDGVRELPAMIAEALAKNSKYPVFSSLLNGLEVD